MWNDLAVRRSGRLRTFRSDRHIATDLNFAPMTKAHASVSCRGLLPGARSIAENDWRQA